MKLTTKQQTNLDSIIEMLPDILSDDLPDVTDPTKFIQIIFDIESDDPEEIAIATKVSDQQESEMAGAVLIKNLPSIGNSPQIQLFAMDIQR